VNPVNPVTAPPHRVPPTFPARGSGSSSANRPTGPPSRSRTWSSASMRGGWWRMMGTSAREERS